VRTVDTYRQAIEHLLKPNLGQLAVGEATTERLLRFISRLQVENGAGAAKSARAVLSGMLGMAARSDAIRGNPVRDLSPISRRARGGAVALTLEQLPVLLERVRKDEQLQRLDLVDLIEFLAGAGCRVGEACGLQ
jgi:integrase